MLSGKRNSAEKAVEFGLINAAVADDSYKKRFDHGKSSMSKCVRKFIKCHKTTDINIHDMTLDQALELAIQENAVARE